ncbi:MAE_28990/MAE_18760 family HEPN-like nuclease [Pseudomonas chlororaphis]|uniref:MAE_28990/MAE_18760 family HEPN-like nuclease n=1 Tax=Pseudomonas chlororaphis TaxID=587753 RepID=UPI0037C9F1E4
MGLDLPKGQITDRFREVRMFLSFIKTQESMDVPPVDSIEVKILRGLYYVQLYGALEQSLNDAAESFLQALSELKLCNNDFSLAILPTVMNSHFKSLSEVQGQKRWKKRVDFISAIANGDLSKIENTVFSPLFQSSEVEVISNVMSYIGINSDPLRESEDRFYVDEVVQKRHQVAHGRVSPVIVGSRGRSDDLEFRLEAVWRIVELVIEMLDEHFKSLSFLTQDAKRKLTDQ